MKLGRLVLTRMVAMLIILRAAMAWGTPSLTEDEVARRARASFPLIAAARLDVEAASGELQAAEGAFDVSLRARGAAVPLGGYSQARADVVTEVPTTVWGTSFFAGYRWGSPDVADYDGKLVTNELGEVRAGTAVSIWRNGPTDRRRTNLERAQLGTVIAERSLEQAELDAVRAAALRYWSWAGACLRRDVVAALVEQASRRVADVSERVARGDLPAIDEVDAQRSVVQRNQLLLTAERALDQATLELSLYLRDPAGAPVLVARERAPRALPSLSDLPPALEADGASLLRRPDLSRLAWAAKQHDAEARWAENQQMPGIDLSAVGSQDFGSGSDKRRVFEVEVGVVIDVPIDTDAAAGRLRAARAGRARVQLHRALLTEQIGVELRDTRAAIGAAVARAGLAAEEGRLAQANVAAERERLLLGETNVFTLDLREQASLEASLREIDATIDARRALIAWRAAAGRLP